MITTENGWLLGDACPEPADGLYWHPKPGGQVLMPVRSIVDLVWPSAVPGLERCRLCRAALASYARSRWGPGKKPVPWAPTAATFDPARPVVEALLGHGFWERIEVVGSLVHLAVLRQEAATTVDLVARFGDGSLGLLALWSSHPAIRPESPWAELGAAVAAMADSGIPVGKVVVIWAGEIEGKSVVSLDAKGGDEALGMWVDTADLWRSRQRHFPQEARHAQP
ncbi:MAG: hypothetical protein KGO47_07235 [Cyanobacteria bacterium REEB417]|nr:hypothetical protein [Cyanobacteria bacterium REEB417]